MASIQARHSRSCALKRPWTTFDDATKDAGCDCTPLYHVVHRHDGRLVRDPVGHVRKHALRALDARRGDLARERYRAVRTARFDAWTTEWLASLAVKPATAGQYAQTLELAKGVFGAMKVRDLGTPEIARFITAVRARGVTEATVAKHLRHLAACLEAAVVADLAEVNPVRKLHRSSKPRATKGAPSYFTNEELARVWTELSHRPLMLALAKVAVGTGARVGELGALRWDDVDLLDGTMHIRRTFTERFGETAPKSGEARTVDLTPPVRRVLEDWYAQSSGEGLVFEIEGGGYVRPRHARNALYAALRRAGVDRRGESGRLRNWHSLRHSYARICLEAGAPIDWVRRQLGHSSIRLTIETYGAWSRSAEKAEAERVGSAFAL
jgi:integrase